MAYSRSTARIQFDLVIKDLLGHSKYASIKKNNIKYEIQQFVFKGAIFQASAALEEYIKYSFEDWIHLANTNNKKIKDLPKDLTSWAAGSLQIKTFKNYILENDESKFIESISINQKLPAILDPESPIANLIHPSSPVTDKKYPSIKNLKTLFRRFGIKDIYSEIAIKGRKDYKSILQSFSDTRTEIAHQHPSPNLTYEDVRLNLKNIQEIVRHLDTRLHSHILRSSGLECWNISQVII